MYIQKHMILLLLVLLSASLPAQKYNFVNWTVEDGLIQSQASFIYQDKFRQLWIGTEGGISCFDGKTFKGYTVQNGLVSNNMNAIQCDSSGNLWLATNQGISIYDGRQFKTRKIQTGSTSAISKLICLNNETVLALEAHSLLEIDKTTCKKLTISGNPGERVTSIYKTDSGDILAAVYQKGIYLFKDKTWQLISPVPPALKQVFIRSFYITSAKDTLIGTQNGLFQLQKNKLKAYHKTGFVIPEVNVFSIAEDSKRNVWFGTDNGCYKIEEGTLLHFNAKSGFTDNAVNHIYKDVENNLWFATNGDGIYKFRENTFTYYDKSSGLSNTIVMGVVQTKDKIIYAGGYGGGLYQLDPKNNLELLTVRNTNELNNSKINCLYADDKSNVWIGTLNKGCYMYNAKSGLQRIEASNNPDISLRGVTVFLKDRAGNMLIGTNQGLLMLDAKGAVTRIKIPSALITALKQFDEEHIIIGTSKGVYLLNRNYEVTPYYEKLFGEASVLCIAKNTDHLWMGTTDNGVFNFNLITENIITYTTADGLPSNFIYSIDVSDKNRAWIGTGFGISRMQLNEAGKILAIKNYGRSDGLLGMECNHNCLLRAADSSLWFGTTKGLFHFTPSSTIHEKNQPFVLLRAVKLFSSLIKDSSLFEQKSKWFDLPDNLKLSSKKNHLTFELGSIYFTNPDDVFYRYRLSGIDKDYTTTNNPVILYPSLPPGKYTLQVTGITKAGAVSSNNIEYSFEIEKAFYQTRFFQLVIILFLLGTGALITYIVTRGKQKRKQKAKELLDKIREEEFMKLRQRTAEDFHDEMGNSLTRISVLTDILKSKIAGKDEDISNLVKQIKENTASLYNGSKDIIWSLNSRNDGLYEIIEHIKDIGIELFQETEVDFHYTHSIDSENKPRLKLDYSRNLTMIFKEAYSNILKHAKANTVNITITLNGENGIDAYIQDNGTGFNTEGSGSGNGLKNMKNRTERMNGTMHVFSSQEKGTEIHIRLNHIFV